MAEAQKPTSNPNGPAEAAKAPLVATKPVITKPEHCCVATYWAVIERDGSIVRGRNVVSAARVGGPNSGQYEVIFTGNVTGGVYQATIGRPGISTEPTGEITVAARFSNQNGVWIDTHDSTGKPSDRAFHVMAFTD